MAHAATEEEVACQFYANMQLLHISLIDTFSNISAKCTYVIFFPHKLAFSTAILILFVFLLPISIRPIGFVTSTIWLPTAWHHSWVRTPVERDYYTVIHNYGNP